MTNPGDQPLSSPDSSSPLEPAVMEQVWDDKYTDADRVWSGDPNGALVAEAQTLPPGLVLDVGCGEGADSVWLAHQGWEVTALDVSGVALQRARQAAQSAGVTVAWLHAGLLQASLPTEGFDLVAALYPALIRTVGHDAQRALLAAVAPGGTLLFIHHTVFGMQPDGHQHGNRDHDRDAAPDSKLASTPQDLVGVADMHAYLSAVGDDWRIQTYEQRPRRIQGGAGSHHIDDVILKARRLR